MTQMTQASGGGGAGTGGRSGGACVRRRDRAAIERAGVRGEWVIANGLGGFAMGTWAGIPARRYHGALIAAERPPVERANLVAGFGEDLVLLDASGEEAGRVHLCPAHFAGHDDRACVNPHLTSFETGPGYARWMLEGSTSKGVAWRVVKTLTVIHGRNASDIHWEAHLEGASSGGARLEIRPLLALRDFHGLNDLPTESEREVIGVRTLGASGVVAVSGGHGVHLHGRGRAEGEGAEGVWARFEEAEAWWRGVEYLLEWERGQDCVEDLFCPGVFSVERDGAGTLSLGVFASVDAAEPSDAEAERRRARDRAARLGAGVIEHAGCPVNAEDAGRLAALAWAGDAFVVRRGAHGAKGAEAAGEHGAGAGGVSVIAGYPWFADWGRDTMICLPGLLLDVGRTEEALGVLATFGAARKDGVIPNRFDDYGGAPHYNTVDASLWYLHASCAWLSRTGDRDRFASLLLPACTDIARWYRRGTMHGIGVDPGDGLVMAGDASTQLTWMDAQRDGVTFTPRYGKAVEINALWIHGLRALAAAVERSGLHGEDLTRIAEWRRWADEASASFARLFWNEEGGWWFDTLRPEGRGTRRHWVPVAEHRPNQVFAMSLAHGPVHGEKGEARATALGRARRALDAVRAGLVVAEGLRTLDPNDAHYKGSFWGPLFDRDAAYHQGTVWPWLMGSYVEAELRLGEAEGRGAEAATEGRRALAGLLGELDGWYPGTIAEVFDGDPTPGPRGRPRWPAGCIAQAWSVAETLRALRLVARVEGGVGL